jgi:sensor histidine kinase YesM
LILLAFDSLDQLRVLFFNYELLFIIFISFVLLESQRAFIHLVEKVFPLQSKPLPDDQAPHKATLSPSTSKIFIITSQLTGTLLFSVLLTSLMLSAYYSLVLKISDFNTELIVFNIVFGIVSLMYTMLHTSSKLLTHHSRLLYSQEKELRKKLEHDLEKFKLQVNPDLLFDSLENLISLVYNDKKSAENYIDHLSKIYRHSLDSRKNELIPLNRELEIVESLYALLAIKYNHNLELTNHIKPKNHQLQIVPGTLTLLLQYAVNGSIVSPYQPLKIILKEEGNHLVFQFDNNQKLRNKNLFSHSLTLINKAYQFYNNEFLKQTTKETSIQIKIPLFEVEEE